MQITVLVSVIRVTQLLFLTLLAMNTMGTKTHYETLLLWPEGAPHAKGTAPKDQPTLKVHLAPSDTATGAAVVVCPGGGFSKLASDGEGLHVAEWLNAIGVSVFVLRYRLRPDYEPTIALKDAQRAIRYVRHHAASFSVDPNRVGVLGFSAGGNLAASAATQYDPGITKASDPVERASSRPDFSVPIYPVIPEEIPRLVTPASPPTFLVATHEDHAPRIRRVLPYYDALLANEVSAEMHVFARGMHGTGMALGDPSLGQWPELLARWLRTHGWLTAKQRTSVRGTVTVDGEPITWGGIALIPEDPNAPVARTYTNGKFSIDAEHGPVPGTHLVEVHLLSRDFSTLSSGNYSMTGTERYRKASPGASAPLLIEIAPDTPLNIDIATK